MSNILSWKLISSESLSYTRLLQTYLIILQIFSMSFLQKFLWWRCIRRSSRHPCIWKWSVPNPYDLNLIKQNCKVLNPIVSFLGIIALTNLFRKWKHYSAFKRGKFAQIFLWNMDFNQLVRHCRNIFYNCQCIFRFHSIRLKCIFLKDFK